MFFTLSNIFYLLHLYLLHLQTRDWIIKNLHTQTLTTLIFEYKSKSLLKTSNWWQDACKLVPINLSVEVQMGQCPYTHFKEPTHWSHVQKSSLRNGGKLKLILKSKYYQKRLRKNVLDLNQVNELPEEIETWHPESFSEYIMNYWGFGKGNMDGIWLDCINNREADLESAPSH